ncbi:MAG: hypothetical protein II151_02320 [Bacteroidales bacterium]|nr:hypothetical protein [Bacteroidales bacterium]
MGRKECSTAMNQVNPSPSRKVFSVQKADRPFFYVITDNETGLILFIGRFC